MTTLRRTRVVLLAALLCAWPRPAPGQDSAPPPAAAEALDSAEIEDLFGFDEGEERIIADPLEGMNRGIFWMNDKFYFYLLKPAARLWRKVPEPGRISVGNFFSNIFSPVRAANCLLQGKIDDFGNEVGRFMVNTTVGVLGFSDRAKQMTGIGPKKEDFGQTLGVWGVGQGPYIVLPFLGTSSARDTVGFVADILIDPIWLANPEKRLLYLTAKGGSYVNATSLDKDTYEAIKEQQLDPYAFIRNAYGQKRQEDVKK